MAAMSHRCMSREEINQILPQVSSLLKDWEKFRKLHDARHDQILMEHLLQEIESAYGKPAKDLTTEIQEMEKDLEKLESFLLPLRRLGCHLKYLDRGYIEFSGLQNNREIYFCWKLGEPEVLYYRLADEDPRNRQQIDF